MLLRALAVWLVLIGGEVVQGALRARYLAPRVGDLRARQLGVFVGSAQIMLIARGFARWLRAESPRAQLRVGGLWVALTLVFEVGFGRRALGYSWQRLASDYDPRRGGLLPVGLAVMALAPWLAARAGRPRGRR